MAPVNRRAARAGDYDARTRTRPAQPSPLRELWSSEPGDFTPWFGDYRLTRGVFLALLGLVYLSAFASLWVQLDGLIGSGGIAPAAELLERADLRLGGEARWRIPSLLWLGSSDGALHGLCAAGVAASLLLVGGVAPRAVLMLRARTSVRSSPV